MSTFRVTYDGPALQTNEMDVRELAPALLAVGDLLEVATRELIPGNTKAQVNVRGSFKTGSFGIEFGLAMSWVRDLLAGPEFTATANALAVLGAIGFLASKKNNLLAALKWLRGRQITRVEVQQESATIYVEADYLAVELNVLKLIRSIPVRDACERMTEPLTQPGITDLYVGRDEGDVAVHITKDERDWFVAPDTDEELLVDEVRRMVFSIVSLAFKEDNKWRLHDGTNTINATISDLDFQHRVDMDQIAFSKGDVLICQVRVRQWQTAKGAKTEHEVIKVLEHRMPGRQISLPGTSDHPDWGKW